MRTTIELPDALFRRAKARAALDGTTLKELITRFVAWGLDGVEQPTPQTQRPRSELPVARPATGRSIPALTNAQLHRILEEDELAG